MRGARRAYANRVNGARSKGPKTPEGKARQSSSVRRHGLSLPVLHDPTLSAEVEDAACKIAKPLLGVEPVGRERESACHIAEATIDLRRIREAKLPLIAALQADPRNSAVLKRLLRLDRYERRATSRRKFAIREFCLIGLAAARPKSATDAGEASN